MNESENGDSGGDKPRAKRKYVRGPDFKICGAKNRQGKPCQNPPMANGRCKNHGGKNAPPGPTHHSYKHGKQSKYLPDKIARRFDEAMADPELLSVRENVALVRVRKTQLEERLDTGESSLIWKQLKECWGEFERGNRIQQDAASLDDDNRAVALADARTIISEALNGLRKLIMGGAAEQNQWNELLDINSLESSLKQSETVRLQRMQQMMTMAEVAVLIHQIQQAVVATIKDIDQQRKLGLALHYILEHGTAPPMEDVPVPAIIDMPELPESPPRATTAE